MVPNPVRWFEIYTADLARARRFYEAVFQLQMAPLPAAEGDRSCMEMMVFPTDMDKPGAGGTLVRMDGVAPGGGGTLIYFACEDCAVEQSRVVAAGGQVSKAKFSIAPYGFIALVVDTEGNMIGLHSLK